MRRYNDKEKFADLGCLGDRRLEARHCTAKRANKNFEFQNEVLAKFSGERKD